MATTREESAALDQFNTESNDRAVEGRDSGGRREAGDRPRASLRVSVGLLVGLLGALVIITAGVTTWARLEVRAAVVELTTRVEPAHQATAALAKAYVDQETGQRGYLLTGDPEFLQPDTAGNAAATQITDTLTGLLSADPAAQSALHEVTASAQRWQQAVGAETAARPGKSPQGGAGTGVGTALVSGKAAFDQLRDQLAVLQARTDALVIAQLAWIDRAQLIANAVTAAAALLAVAASATAAMLWRSRLARPLEMLRTQTHAVATGDYQHPIALPRPPRELAAVADDVKAMRDAVLTHATQLAAAQHDLADRQVRDAIAADVHDTTIQRLYALGLGLQIVLARVDDPPPRSPATEASGADGAEVALADLVDAVEHALDEISVIQRELRSLILGMIAAPTASPAPLRTQLDALIKDSARALGFTPTLVISGPLDDLDPQVKIDLLAVTRESLSNIGRHACAATATVRIHAAPTRIELTVTDDGLGIPPRAPHRHGLKNILTRAARHHGHASITLGSEGGTVVNWAIPAPTK